MKGQVTQQTIDAAFREGYEACLKKRADVVKEIEQLHQQVALLRAEVETWRAGCSSSDAVNVRWVVRIEQAMRATDAAGALEDK